jgi:hypothetical protein
MNRTWAAAAIAASLIAFAASYAIAKPGSGEQREVEPMRSLRLDSGPTPAGWQRVQVPDSPAVLAYPPGWRTIPGDRGTASAALRVHGRIVGYLNATPQGGTETLANWLSFRPDHNREEGDLDVTPLAGSRGLQLRTGRASCLVDSYATESGAHYRELACIVAGRKATTVIVGSAVPERWTDLAPVLRRAASSFTT